MIAPFKAVTRAADPSRVLHRARVIRLWALLAVLCALLIAPLWSPLHRAWRCYLEHARGARAEAVVVENLEQGALAQGMLALRLETGPQAGQICTMSVTRELAGTARSGERLAIVYLDERPGYCVLASSVANSRVVLIALSGGLGCVLLLILALGILFHRSCTLPGLPQRRLDVDPGSVCCPGCGAKMAEGYLPLLAGVHWRALGEPVGLPNALGGLPGTVGWRDRSRVHAFHCTGCEVITFQYGLSRRVEA